MPLVLPSETSAQTRTVQGASAFSALSRAWKVLVKQEVGGSHLHPYVYPLCLLTAVFLRTCDIGGSLVFSSVTSALG